jgi:hypothetical protein
MKHVETIYPLCAGSFLSDSDESRGIFTKRRSGK